METSVQLLEDIVTDKMGEYSTYVLLSRAIPDLRDGLKPSYRRILWAMNEMKATSFTKSANIAGEVMRFHPHGSTYNTMVGMAQTDGQLNPYLVGKGNFGNHASELAYASDRYTEAKLSEISINMIADSKKHGVEMIDNYDSTRKIPEVFPVKYPSVLAYAQSGIGVGFSSSIPSFNITELCEATIKYINNGEKVMLVPDFGTKATIIEDDDIIKSINYTGRGSIQQRAKAEIEGNEIIVTEIPYDTTKEKILDKIRKMYKEDKLKEVRQIDDLSGLAGMSFVITAKKNTDMEALREKLYQNTPMQASYSSNMMVINTKGLPELKGVWGIIDEWLTWRKEVINKMLLHDTQLKKKQLEVLNGLNLIKDDLDEVVEVIRKSTDSNVIKNLMSEFELTRIQAERIAELRLKNLTTTFIKKQIQNIKSLEKEIKENTKAINSDSKKEEMIVQDLNDTIVKFGKERQTEVIHKSDVLAKTKNIAVEPEFENYNVRVFVTKENYIKKTPLTSLRGDFSINVKHGDEVISEVETTNAEEVLIFTDKQKVFKKKLYELPDSKPSDLGVYLPNEIELEKDENILHVAPLNSEHSYIVIGYEDGKVAKIDVQSYRTKQNRSVLRNGYADKTPLLFKAISEDFDLLAIADNEKTVLMNTDVVNSKSSKNTQGSAFIKLKNDSVVREYIVNPEIEDKEYYRLGSAGVGKYKK